MKIKTKNLLKSIVSIMLCLSMVLSTPLIAFASNLDGGEGNESSNSFSGVKDVNGDGKINYVSFGDSVTNGYGMVGYRYDDGTNVSGLYRTPEGSYPVLIEEELEELWGKGNVELSQLAISGFRIEELHWMLSDDYVPDQFHYYWFREWNIGNVNNLLAKAVDAVYDADPRTNPDAKRYDEVSIDEVIEKNLQVVDMTASILARDNKMPMWVFGLNEENSIVNTVKGNFNGTKVLV